MVNVSGPRRPTPGWRRTAAPLLCALALCGLAGSVRLRAMVTVPAEFTEMAAASQIVVHGRVIDVQPYETAGRTTIESLVTVEVVESLKGAPGRTAYFRIPGGRVGRYRRVMVGAPEFARGDEVIVFLKGRSPAVPMPFGLTQGVYRVVRDRSGRAAVTPLAPAGSGRLVRGDPARRPLELGAFTALVRELAGARP